jgi:hypothetical protein
MHHLWLDVTVCRVWSHETVSHVMELCVLLPGVHHLWRDVIVCRVWSDETVSHVMKLCALLPAVHISPLTWWYCLIWWNRPSCDEIVCLVTCSAYHLWRDVTVWSDEIASHMIKLCTALPEVLFTAAFFVAMWGARACSWQMQQLAWQIQQTVCWLLCGRIVWVLTCANTAVFALEG